jgi:hypothetical protein
MLVPYPLSLSIPPDRRRSAPREEDDHDDDDDDDPDDPDSTDSSEHAPPFPRTEA